MSLDSIVSITISSNTRGITRTSFGIPLVIGYHTAWMEKYRVYDASTALASLITDGIAAGTPIYKSVASAVSSQNKPKQVAVGRLISAPTHTGTITVKASEVEVGKVYSLTVQAPDGGATTAVSYTSLAGGDEDDVATALAAGITAISDITASATGGVVTWTGDNAGEIWRFTGMDLTLLDFSDETVDSSLVTELTAITNEYPAWYALYLADAPSKARILALAANIETQERIFMATSRDTENLNASSTTAVGYALKAADYFRTACIFSNDQTTEAGARWLGGMLPMDPGSATWIYKSLSGTTVDNLTANQIAGLKAHNVSYYITEKGASVTFGAKMAGGEWIDVVRGRDWLKVRMQERIFLREINSPKIPYTQKGAESIGNDVRAQLGEGIGAGYLAEEPEYIVTVPDVLDSTQVSAANKIARTLPNVSFECTLAGAIHAVEIYGVIQA